MLLLRSQSLVARVLVHVQPHQWLDIYPMPVKKAKKRGETLVNWMDFTHNYIYMCIISPMSISFPGLCIHNIVYMYIPC